MSTAARNHDVADVDYLVDESGNPIEVNRDTPVSPTGNEDAAVGGTGPTYWWRYGLVALLVLVAILLAMQLLSGNKGTDVIPGTPVAAPQNNVPVPGAQ